MVLHFYETSICIYLACLYFIATFPVLLREDLQLTQGKSLQLQECRIAKDLQKYDL